MTETQQPQNSDPPVYVYSPPDKDGKQTLGTVPTSQLSDVLNNGKGYRKAVMMTAPDGKTKGWVPPTKVTELLKPENGYKIGPPSAVQEGAISRFLKGAGGDLANMGEDLATTAMPNFDKNNATSSLANQSWQDLTSNEGIGGPANVALMPLARLIKGAARAQYQSSVDMQEKASKAAEKGDNAGVMINSIGAGLPLVGQLINGIYEQADSGDTAGAAGKGLVRAAMAASMAPEGSVIPNPLRATANAVNKIIPAPKPPLARTLPNLSRESAATATPHIQSAAQDLGIDLTKELPVDPETGQAMTTADAVRSAAKLAKHKLMLHADQSAGEGQTFHDLPEDVQQGYRDQLKAISEVEKTVGDAQAQAAKNTSAPTTRGQAALDVAKGAGKIAIADTAGRLIPGGRLVADAVGVGAGGSQVVRGIKGLIRPNAVTPEVLNTRLQQAFSRMGPSNVPGVPPEAAEAPQPYQPVEDTVVEHTGIPRPPETAGGDVGVTPVNQNPRTVSQVADSSRSPVQQPPEWQGPIPQREPMAVASPVNRAPVRISEPSQVPIQEQPQWQGPIPQREPIGEPIAQSQPAPEAPANTPQPFKAKTPEAALTETLKKAGVAAPKATQQGFEHGVPGSTLPVRDFETFPGADTGEKAALQSLTHYSINELRAIAQQRGIKVAAGDSHVDLIGKIHDDLTPEEIQHFHDAATAQETARQSPVGPGVQHPENLAIAKQFYDSANKLEQAGGKPYDVAAYRTGARAIEDHPEPMSKLDPKDIQKIPGIGKKLGQEIQNHLHPPDEDLTVKLQESIDQAKAGQSQKVGGLSDAADNQDIATAKATLGPDASVSHVLLEAQRLKDIRNGANLRGSSEDAFYTAKAKQALGDKASAEDIAAKAKELKAANQRPKK